MDPALLWRTGIGLTVMLAAALALLAWRRIHLGWQPVIAVLRAGVQLALVALLLRGVLEAPWTAVAFVALMLTTASLTAGGRLHELAGGRSAATLGVIVGGLAVPSLILALGIVPLQPTQVIAIAGILIGNAMTAATLAGRQFASRAEAQSGQLEAWWALGASNRLAHEQVARSAVREALLPGIDQTRSTGLVTLPGAFVGALFGGASPWEAGRFQLVVLVGILLVQTITTIVVTSLLSRSGQLPSTSAGS